MTDSPETAPYRAPSWGVIQEKIQWWLVARFGVGSDRDKDIWLFCIGAAMELERLAVGVLWITDGRPVPFYEYAEKMTLGQAHQEIEKRKLLDPSTRTILKEVSALRNSVAHRHAIFVTVDSPIEEQSVEQYKGYHVFMVREALDELMRDFDTAAKVMYDWMAEKAPDLAEEARRGGFAGPDQAQSSPPPPAPSP